MKKKTKPGTRPATCPKCGGPIVQGLVERLDVDGELLVGSVECRACDARWIYVTPRPTLELLRDC